MFITAASPCACSKSTPEQLKENREDAQSWAPRSIEEPRSLFSLHLHDQARRSAWPSPKYRRTGKNLLQMRVAPEVEQSSRIFAALPQAQRKIFFRTVKTAFGTKQP